MGVIGTGGLRDGRESGFGWAGNAAQRATVVLVKIAAPTLGPVERWLSDAGYRVDVRHDGLAVTDAAVDADVVLLEIDLPAARNLLLLERIRAQHPRIPVVAVVAEKGEGEACVSAMRRGASDFLEGPLECLRLLTSVENAIVRGRLRKRLLEWECAAAAAVPIVAPGAPVAEPHQATPARLGWTLEEIEKDSIVRALRAAHGNVSATVRQLRIGRSTLYRKLKRFGIEVDAQRK